MQLQQFGNLVRTTLPFIHVFSVLSCLQLCESHFYEWRFIRYSRRQCEWVTRCK